MRQLRIEKLEEQPTVTTGQKETYIPYQNNKGEYVFRTEGDSIDMEWPGWEAPDWATELIKFQGTWYWVGEDIPEDIVEALGVVEEIKYGIEDIIAGTLPEVDEGDTYKAKMLNVLLDWFKNK